MTGHKYEERKAVALKSTNGMSLAELAEAYAETAARMLFWHDCYQEEIRNRIEALKKV